MQPKRSIGVDSMAGGGQGEGVEYRGIYWAHSGFLPCSLQLAFQRQETTHID